MEPKPLLRSRVVAARGRRDAADRERAGLELAAHGLAAWGDATRVACYAGFGSEPPTRPLLDGLRGAGVTVLLPVIAEGDLEWAPYAGWEDLVTGPLGAPEPSAGRRPSAWLTQAQVVVVPALAVDTAGNRLGRGAGFYDRALAAVERRRIVAIVFDDEVLATVPAEARDRPVGAVLTPSGLRTFSA